MSKHNPTPALYEAACKVNRRDYIFSAQVEPRSDASASPLQMKLILRPRTVNRVERENPSALVGVLSTVFRSLDSAFPPGSFMQVREDGYTPGKLTFTHTHPEDQRKILEALDKIPGALDKTLAALYPPPARSPKRMMGSDGVTGADPRPGRIPPGPSRN